MKLLLFKVSGVTESLLFLPVAQQLRRLFPKGEITVLAGAEAVGLYEGKLGASRVVAAERGAFQHAWANPRAFFRFWWEARRTQAEACLIGGEQGAVAHILGQMVVPGARVGAAEVRLRVPTGLTHRVVFPRGARVAEFEWELGRALAAALGRFDWPLKPVAPELGHWVEARPTREAREGKRRVVVCVDGEREHELWPGASWALVAAKLAAEFDVVWLERPGAESVALASGVERVVVRGAKEVAGWLAGADLMAGNHGVGLQVAAALGVPAVVVAGPIHPEWDPVWGAERFLILRAEGLGCLPCDAHGAQTGRCGNAAEPLACMRRWSVEAVEGRCREWIDKWGVDGRR